MTIRSFTFVFAVCAAASSTFAQAPVNTPPATAPATGPSAFKTESERVGYAIGLQIGPNLKGVDYDDAALAAGIRDAVNGNKPKMSEGEIETTMKALQATMIAKGKAEQAVAAKAGEQFLVDNGKKEGVKTTASGLQYKVIASGTGKSPKATDVVSVNYRGTLISGKEFDASAPGKPVQFPVNRVIPGWTEALQLMKEGDKWQLFIPAKLAYGEDGPPEIGPNATLIFDVELLAVNPAPAAP